HIITILSRINHQKNCFICDLDNPNDQLSAHQLIADGKDYAAVKFNQKKSMVALLTTDNHVHFFDYKTLMLIAKTKELVKDNVIFDIFLHKCLDFDETGNHLAAALKT